MQPYVTLCCNVNPMRLYATLMAGKSAGFQAHASGGYYGAKMCDFFLLCLRPNPLWRFICDLCSLATPAPYLSMSMKSIIITLIIFFVLLLQLQRFTLS